MCPVQFLKLSPDEPESVDLQRRRKKLGLVLSKSNSRRTCNFLKPWPFGRLPLRPNFKLCANNLRKQRLVALRYGLGKEQKY